MDESKKLYEAVLKGDASGAHEITENALNEGVDPLTLIDEHMIPAMEEVGRRFQCQDFFVPELLLAARAMKAALALIRPLLAERGDTFTGRVVLGTVKGDLHDIGKNLVGALLEGAGFKVIDLGVNVEPEQFVEAVKTEQAHVVALSALLTTTLPSMKSTIDALESAGLREKTKVLIGGAPVTQSFADTIGADGYSENAVEAVSLAKQAMCK